MTQIRGRTGIKNRKSKVEDTDRGGDSSSFFFLAKRVEKRARAQITSKWERLVRRCKTRNAELALRRETDALDLSHPGRFFFHSRRAGTMGSRRLAHYTCLMRFITRESRLFQRGVAIFDGTRGRLQRYRFV